MSKHNSDLIYNYAFSPSSPFYQKYRIKILGGGALTTSGKICEGISTTQVRLDFGAIYNGKLNTLLANAHQKVMEMGKKLFKEFNYAQSTLGLGGTFISDVSVADTIATYSNSVKPTIVCGMVWVRGVTPNLDEMLKTTAELIAPYKIKGCYISSPANYRPTSPCKDGVDDSNTYRIYFGQWLLVRLMLPVGVSITPSQQLHSSGKPLYYIVSFTFESARELEYSEIARWFV